MDHGTATEWGKDNAAAYKSRLGITLFLIYSAVYAGFVLISTVSPGLMSIPMFGMNLAVVYGFGLIGFALVLAFAYNALCTRTEERLNQKIKEVSAWFDTLQASGRLPQSWDRQKAMVFCEALIGLETEVSYEEGRNLTAIDAFYEIFEKQNTAKTSGGAQ